MMMVKTLNDFEWVSRLGEHLFLIETEELETASKYFQKPNSYRHNESGNVGMFELMRNMGDSKYPQVSEILKELTGRGNLKFDYSSEGTKSIGFSHMVGTISPDEYSKFILIESKEQAREIDMMDGTPLLLEFPKILSSSDQIPFIYKPRLTIPWAFGWVRKSKEDDGAFYSQSTWYAQPMSKEVGINFEQNTIVRQSYGYVGRGYGRSIEKRFSSAEDIYDNLMAEEKERYRRALAVDDRESFIKGQLYYYKVPDNDNSIFAYNFASNPFTLYDEF